MKISKIKGILLLSIIQIVSVAGYAAISIMKQLPFTWDIFSFMDYYTKINSGMDYFWTVFIPMLLGFVLILLPFGNSNRLLFYGSRKRIFCQAFYQIVIFTLWSTFVVLIAVAAVSAYLGKPFCNWKDYGSYYNVTLGQINSCPPLFLLISQVFLLIIRGVIFGSIILITSYKKILVGLFLSITIGMLDYVQSRIPFLLRLTSLDPSFWIGSMEEKALRITLSVVLAVVFTIVAYHLVKRREYV